jgi:ribosomal protein L40E
MIVKICRKCGGSGNTLVSVKPITFKDCNKCGGNGGRSMPKGEQQ